VNILFQDGSSGSSLAGSPSGTHRPSKFAAPKQLQGTEIASIDALLHLLVETLVSHLVPNLEHTIRGFRLIGQGNALFHGQPKWLLAEHVLPGLETGPGRLEMLIIGQGDDHGVDLVHRNDIPPIGKGLEFTPDQR
jgi:hypothetical protein